MSLMTMKEVSQLTCITENALRYYNEKGILPPTVRKETGRKQWLYDDEAVIKLKKLALLKFIGISLEDIKIAIHREEEFHRIIRESLEKLKKAREELDLKIFVAQALLMTQGVDIFRMSGDHGGMNSAVLNEVIREYFRESVVE